MVVATAREAHKRSGRCLFRLGAAAASAAAGVGVAPKLLGLARLDQTFRLTTPSIVEGVFPLDGGR